MAFNTKPFVFISGVQIIMAIIGCISGIVSVITIIASIMKMLGKGRVEVQEIEIRQVKSHLNNTKLVPWKIN